MLLTAPVAATNSCATPPTVGVPTTTGASAEKTSAVPPDFTPFVVNDGCPLATGHIVVRHGDLTMGPFEDESADSQSIPSRKLWVASQRPGSEEVTLTVTAPGGHTETQGREFSGAQVSNAKQFWPGTIPVPVSGQYRIEASVGADHLCVTTTYRH